MWKVGGLVVFFIEMVYGLGVNVCEDLVVVWIFEVKECFSFNFLIVYVVFI